ncbi:MAG: hypothetical protein M3328_17305, partial [Chloroflexota bacterium]|nr:hypothetical protein [Chloroflexota bacterium]
VKARATRAGRGHRLSGQTATSGSSNEHDELVTVTGNMCTGSREEACRSSTQMCRSGYGEVSGAIARHPAQRVPSRFPELGRDYNIPVSAPAPVRVSLTTDMC